MYVLLCKRYTENCLFSLIFDFLSPSFCVELYFILMCEYACYVWCCRLTVSFCNKPGGASAAGAAAALATCWTILIAFEVRLLISESLKEPNPSFLPKNCGAICPPCPVSQLFSNCIPSLNITVQFIIIISNKDVCLNLKITSQDGKT